jgi:hypothetical protein
MSVTVPVAKKPDGSPIQGVGRADFVPDQALKSFSLGDRLFFPIA